MKSYDELHALRMIAQRDLQEAQAAERAAYEKYRLACDAASEAFDREIGWWNPASLTTTLEDAPVYQVSYIASPATA